MGSLAYAGGSHRASNSTPPVTSPPFTVAGWYQPTSVTNVQCLFYLGSEQDTAARDAHRVIIGSEGTLRALSGNIDGTASGAAIVTNACTIGTWHHVVARWSASNSRRCVVDGDLGGARSNSTNVAVGTPTMLGIGGEKGIGWGSGTRGALENWALWAAALTDAEAVALSRGLPPAAIRPQSLVCWWRNMGRGPAGTVRDWRGLAHLAVSGATQSDLSPVIQGQPIWSGWAGVAASGPARPRVFVVA